MAKSKHDQIAERLAKKFGVEYKKSEGIDIVTKEKAIEIETKKGSLYQGINQIKRASKARYLAVNKLNIKNALEATKGTGIGVMGPTGRIIKRAKRK